MPNSYILNQRFSVAPTTYGPIVSMLVEFLVAAGWTYQASGAGGGGGFNPTGKVFVTTGSGANGWGNGGAWARIQDPGGGREFVIQQDENGGAIIKYSASAKFTGGTPSQSALPTAADEKYLRGAAGSYGGNFFPRLSPSFAPTIAGTIWQGAAMATPPYGFWFACQVAGGFVRMTNMMMDPVIGDPADPDPVVIVIGDATTNANSLGNGLAYSSLTAAGSMGSMLDATAASTSNGGTNTGPFAHMDVAKSIFLPVRALGYTCGAFYSSGQAFMTGKIDSTNASTLPRDAIVDINTYSSGVNPFNNKPEYLPVLWSRLQFAGVPASWVGAPSGSTTSHNIYVGSLKGWSTMCRWTGVNRSSFADTTDNKNKICVGAWWLPWDGVTTPLF